MATDLGNPIIMQLHMQQQMAYQQHFMACRQYQQDEMTSSYGWSMLNPGSVEMRGPSLPDDVKVELENKKLWQQFHAENTEMIITKSGRRMFPSVQLSVSGLERRAQYCVVLELAPASERRHKYVGAADGNGSGGGSGGGAGEPRGPGPKGWTTAGPAEPQPPLERRIYLHPDSPASGAHWMQHPISFSKLKLTNNVTEHHSNVLLTSMHKYVPRIRVVRCDSVTGIRDLYANPSAQFSFRETEFIAVTAYQNENITKLKINNNPFAKGFRESGQSACKRKRLSRDGDSSSAGSHDEEASASDSDSPLQPHSPKRARLDDSDSGSGSGSERAASASPAQQPPVLQQPPAPQQPQQPKFHRPWADDDEAPRQPPNNPPGLYDAQAAAAAAAAAHHHYQLVALEIARLRHMHHQRNFLRHL